VDSLRQATFSDAGSDSPFYAYIETAHTCQLFNGYADGTFRSSAPAIRGQTCKIIANIGTALERSITKP
jgi:hypothetical protein